MPIHSDLPLNIHKQFLTKTEMPDGQTPAKIFDRILQSKDGIELTFLCTPFQPFISFDMALNFLVTLLIPLSETTTVINLLNLDKMTRKCQRTTTTMQVIASNINFEVVTLRKINAKLFRSDHWIEFDSTILGIECLFCIPIIIFLKTDSSYLKQNVKQKSEFGFLPFICT
ncbi:hypothetical protein EGR_10085 [Echinococcus granulosus]|uniref:Uncharacterized protein n=1 Tax=Echinococcus granulosus TaxID=6210 RepID=W6UNV4_ECHGR|nr:hypothetical protein EGR_10085 [Echinococcus granulosus]EUB55064.1 hypothetical protein EGR_10085 [Echinococcus granulosus]